MPDVRAPARTLVLTNSDLLHCIFTFVPEPLSDNPSSRNYVYPHYLAPCTTVCRAFYLPAVQHLWRTLPSLFPLWYLLAPPNTKCPPSYYTSPPDTKQSDYIYQVSIRVLW